MRRSGCLPKRWAGSRGNEGYRQHLVLALEAKADRSAAMDELKTLLAGDARGECGEDARNC